MTVSIVVISHSEKIADGAAELAAQMAPDVEVLTAGGTTDGRIGTSLEKVMAALDKAGGTGTVIIADLGSAVMTAESALEFAENPGGVLLADAPLVEGLVAAAVAAQGGADMQAVKLAAETVGGSRQGPEGSPVQTAGEGAGPDATGDFELVNQAGMHARPAAKIAGGLSSLNAEVKVNGVDGASMTGLMTLAAGRGSVLHVEAWGADAERAVDYVRSLVQAGFGEP
ncbi:dihydroxyacetone kinase phosphoryl donor subunit DhaM [Pseudarthrobacter sp. NamE5]|uniref:dihydroxyacetone kinase phosphoryl donor subunit DhaM n=1 Tax=Pseudarthrobacter sp. NamE5 TaxID=2576839 RepID=UPI00110B3F9F|nr:dihydroxyacetone kinase phosphoryl donor subunit DhaM [Pseudarthrobacter sp. NamE5]TLM88067.1 PTS-dependent dihydroxyacetone kinase phosphotransferase subunit DhaM [Pseudarthrobacter sp. NamE5]